MCWGCLWTREGCWSFSEHPKRVSTKRVPRTQALFSVPLSFSAVSGLSCQQFRSLIPSFFLGLHDAWIFVFLCFPPFPVFTHGSRSGIPFVSAFFPGPYEVSPEIRMDQWRSKFSQSFSLDRHWSMECSSLKSRIWFFLFSALGGSIPGIPGSWLWTRLVRPLLARTEFLSHERSQIP